MDMKELVRRYQNCKYEMVEALDTMDYLPDLTFEENEYRLKLIREWYDKAAGRALVYADLIVHELGFTPVDLYGAKEEKKDAGD